MRVLDGVRPADDLQVVEVGCGAGGASFELSKGVGEYCIIPVIPVLFRQVLHCFLFLSLPLHSRAPGVAFDEYQTPLGVRLVKQQRPLFPHTPPCVRACVLARTHRRAMDRCVVRLNSPGKVVALEANKKLLDTALQMARKGRLDVASPSVGSSTFTQEVSLSEDANPSRIIFKQCDPMCLPAGLTGESLVLFSGFVCVDYVCIIPCFFF